MTAPRLPLTAAQRAIWLDETTSPIPALHTMGDYLDITGELDVATFCAALTGLAQEAEVMRVRFVELDGLPAQLVDDSVELPVELVDLSNTPDALDRALAAMRADLHRAVELSSGPLVRATVFVLSAQRHLCFVAMHHVLCDGYSRVPLYGRLARIYRALAAGVADEGAPLPPLHVLVDQEQAYRGSPAQSADRAYWTGRAAHLGDPFTLSQLPLSPSRAFLRRTASVDSAAAGALRGSARAAGVPWASYAIAATATYLAKVAGRTDALLTLPVTARSGAAARLVPGMVANYLPLALGVGARTTGGALVDEVAGSVVHTLRHQRLRIEEVRRLAGLPIDDRRPFGPYVNVLPGSPELDLGSARAVLQNLSTGTVEDFMVTFADERDGSMAVHVNGNPAMYTADDILAHAQRLAAFLPRFARADPDEPIGRLGVLADEDAAALAAGAGPVTTELYVGVVDRVREHGRSAGSATAVVDDQGSLSYEDLLTGTDGLARRLGGTSLVAILAEPGRHFITSVLGVLAGAGAFIPLDVRAPVLRTAGLLSDCAAGVVVVDRAHRGLAEEVLTHVRGAGPEPVLVVVDDAVTRTPQPGVPLAQDVAKDVATVQAGPGDPAYVLFTSGTTGRPKGAVVLRSGMVNHLLSKIELLDLDRHDVLVQNAPVTFDVSIWQMLAPLLVGGTVRVVPSTVASDPDALGDVVRRDGVTVLEVVPSLLSAALPLWSREVTDLAGLRVLMVTGEALPADLCASWARAYPAIPLVNAYGPTECSDDVAHAVLRAATPDGTTPVAGSARAPIGTPIRNTTLTVRGPDLLPVPAGAVGELYVSGAGVGLGYLGDPAKTAATFVADPSGPPGTRTYRTGDRVRWTSGGQLEFVERLDHQVKIRGQRVELGEIEAALRAVAPVSSAVVAAHRDRTGSAHLCAYLVGPGVHEALDQIRSAVRSVLPEHMVPARWAVLESLPLTAHGKVDRLALPALEPGAAAGSRPAPRPDVSAQPDGSAAALAGPVGVLQAAFADVLGLPHVAADQNFFALGGDSIGAIQAVAAARRGGVTITPRDVFALGTPAALAAHGAVARAGEPAGPVTRPNGPVELELTPIAAQLAQDTGCLDGPASHYAQYAVLQGPHDLGPNHVERLLAALVLAHDVLRLSVTDHAPGVWSHRVSPGAAADEELAAVRAQVRRVPGTADPAEQVRLAGARLDPAAGVVWQAVLVETARPLLILVLHHLVVDGVSWRILREDLRTAWPQVTAGAEPVVPGEPVPFAAWAQAQAVVARSGSFVGAELDLWRGQDARPQLVPAEAGRTAPTYAAAHQLRLELDTPTTAALLTATGAYRADVNDLLLGALAVALADWREAAQKPALSSATGSALPSAELLTAQGPTSLVSAVVELEGHGREELLDRSEQLDVSRTVGWFTSTFPVEIAAHSGRGAGLDRAEALTAAVKSTHQSLRSIPRHGIGYGMLRHQHPCGQLLLGDQATPSIGFNYLGRIPSSETDTAAADWAFVTLPDGTGVGDPGPGDGQGRRRDALQLVGSGAIGTCADPRMPLRHPLAVTAVTQDRDGGPCLVADWLYAPGAVADDSALDLASCWFAALRDLLATADRRGNRSLVPADAPLVPVTAQDLDALEAERPFEEVTEVLPVTPIQRGMLFQAEFDEARADPYILQVCADLEGPLSPRRFQRALRDVVDANPVLSAAFRYTLDGTPLMVLGTPATIPVRLLTLSDLPAADGRESTDPTGGGVDSALAELAQREREERFDLAAGTALRCALVRLGPDLHRVVLTVHHVLLDGWSMPLVVRDLLDCYERSSPPATRRPSYTRYLEWLTEQDVPAGLQAWRAALRDVDGPTLVASVTSGEPGGATSTRSWRLDGGETERVEASARASGVTVHTVVQVAWAGVLAAMTGRRDVLFGATVSTRPAELAGVEDMVGMFLNTVAVRVRALPGEDAGSLLHRVQSEQAELHAHRHVGISAVTAGHPTLAGMGDPFDTTVVLELAAYQTASIGDAGDLRVRRASAWDARHFPLSLVVFPGERLSFRFDYDQGVFDAEAIDGVCSSFAAALRNLVAGVLPAALVPVDPTAETQPAPTPPETVGYRAPSTQVESAVATAFASVLRHPRVGVEDNFFVLGGDSISAIHVVTAARELGVRITPRDVFTWRTPAAIAAHAREPEPPEPARSDAPAGGPAALSLSEHELDALDAELGFRGTV